MSGPEPRFPWLERLTAVVLLLVVLALGWIVLASYQPAWVRLASVELEVVLVLGLLTAGLVLVSVVALLHTRDQRKTMGQKPEALARDVPR